MDVQADLKSYYEEEARLRTRGPLKGGRAELRARYLTLLEHEGRAAVIDFGAGPGRDAPAFLEAGFRYLGVDLSEGNARLAAESDIAVVPGSLAAPPVRAGSFDAGWSMSTLMHIPEAQVPAAAAAMVAVLAPGSPLYIGQWGGTLGEHIDDEGIEGERRLFSLRTMERNQELLQDAASIEHAEIWPTGPDGWQYHVCLLRTPGQGGGA